MTATTTAPTAPSAPPGSTAAGPTAPPRKFRPEVQALRALAVLLVIVYHVDPALLPGGYIGVDVFFVISGFLITGHLWREASTTGTVSLKKFWAARARRILPASLVATVGTLAVALVLLPLDLLQLWWRHALASVFYVENWALAADAVDYQAAGNERRRSSTSGRSASRSSSTSSGRSWWSSRCGCGRCAPDAPPGRPATPPGCAARCW